jgi:hypothetical protein
MKQFSLILLCFCFKISFSQNLAKLNLKDSCIITGGVMSVADFKKVCKVCPEGMKKVTGYLISHTVNHMAVDFPLKNGRWNSSFIKNPGMGTILVIENIKGLDAKGKTVTAPQMVIGLK